MVKRLEPLINSFAPMKTSSPYSSILACSLAVGALAPATLSATPGINVIPIANYQYLAGGAPNPVYPDLIPASRLTDGETGSLGSWYNGAFVLWKEASPEISFNFGQQQEIASFSVFFLSNQAAGTVLPEEIRLTSSSDPSISYTFTLDRADYPTPTAQWFNFTLPDVMITDRVTLWTSPNTNSSWMGMSEVQFQAVPEPNSVALILGAGALAALAIRRKKGFR